jgi:hypothetical protein
MAAVIIFGEQKQISAFYETQTYMFIKKMSFFCLQTVHTEDMGEKHFFKLYNSFKIMVWI